MTMVARASELMPRRIAGPCTGSPGCPNRAGHCAEHQRQANREHNQRYGDNYDAEHEALRAEYQARMDAGETFTCWRGGEPIDPTAWDLGHYDNQGAHAGPECIPCNRAVAGRPRRGG